MPNKSAATPEQVAEKIIRFFRVTFKDGDYWTDLTNEIAKALTDFGQQRYNDGLEEGKNFKFNLIKNTPPTQLIWDMSRNEALEETAKIVEQPRHPLFDTVTTEISRQIRALKSIDGEQGK